ncbi:MAG: phage portal protein [Candidatus Nanopelagicales bacterium]
MASLSTREQDLREELTRVKRQNRSLRSSLTAKTYENAKKDRLNRERTSHGGDGNDHLDAETLWTLRETSRDLDRNCGLAIGIIDRCVENIFGPSGFDLLPKTGKKSLNERIDEDWNDYLETCDARGEFHGWDLFARSFRSAEVDGDHFLQLWDDGTIFSFEGDRVVSPYNAANRRDVPSVDGLRIINGIARDSAGRKRWAFVADDVPDSWQVRADEGQLIPFDTLIQISDPRRMTQNRSEPRVSPIIRDIDDVDDLLLYERIASKIVAAQAYFVKSASPEGAAEAMKSAADSTATERIEEIVPGMVHYLGLEEDIASAPSNRPSTNFNDFIMLLNRYVGLPLGLPLELILLDFSNVNFASSRQLLNQAQRRFKCQQVRAARWISQVYRWWLQRQIASGVYDKGNQKQIGSGAIFRHKWGFPGWPSPNPLQDAQAIALGLEWEFESRTNANRARGISQDAIFDELTGESARTQNVSEDLQPMEQDQNHNDPQNSQMADLQKWFGRELLKLSAQIENLNG